MGKRKWLQMCKGVLAIALIVAMCFGLVPVDSLSGLIEVSAEETITLTNGDFEVLGENTWTIPSWTISLNDGSNWGTANSKSAGSNNTSYYLELSNYKGVDLPTSVTQTLSLTAGTYTATIQSAGANEGSGTSALVFTAVSGSSILDTGDITLGGWDTWSTTTINFTLENPANVTIGVTGTLADSSYCDLDNVTLALTSSTEENGDDDITGSLVNGDFAEDVKTDGNGWSVTSSVSENYTAKNDNGGFNFWIQDGGSITLTHSTVNLEKGTYQLSVKAYGDAAKLAFQFGDTIESETEYHDVSGNSYSTITSKNFTISEAGSVSVALVLSIEANGWGYLDDVTITKVETTGILEQIQVLLETVPKDTADFTADSAATLATAVEAAKSCNEASDLTTVNTCYENLKAALSNLRYSDNTIYVEKVDNLSDDFIKGIDISSYISETDSGVVYRDWNGNAVDGVGFIKLFADAGVNYIRLRVWNAPYVVDANGNAATDADGNIMWYGGGNNNLATTKEICKIIAEYNDTYDGDIKVLIDFHYSDFWVDPEKQNPPKAWADITDITELTAKVTEFTKSSLEEIASTGVKIGMVQIGNETNNGICGQTVGTDGYYKVFAAGCDAVKAYDSEILTVVHYTDPQTSGLAYNFAQQLCNKGVNYDVYATSYYPYWHGTTDNLYSVLNSIATDFDKKVMVAETQYVYTNDDYDGSDNQAYEDKDNIDLSEWSVSVQGQANEIRDVIAAVAKVGENGIGVFYWEPAWLGVGNAYDSDGNLDADKLAANKTKWNIYGSGWATDYAAEFDPSAAKWGGGGTNNENASLFDFNGNPLASLNVFKYVNYGAVALQKSFYRVEESAETTVQIGFTAAQIKEKLPSTVTFSYNDGSVGTTTVAWDESSINELVTTIASSSVVGNTYKIKGTVTVDGASHKFNVSVYVEPQKNYLVNGDFEETTGWKFQNDSILFYKADNERHGTWAITFNTYSNGISTLTPDANGCYQASVYQTVTLPAGVYEAKVYFEGNNDAQDGSAGKNAGEYLNISATYGGKTVTSDNVVLDGWKVWQCATVSQIVITEDMVKAGTNTVTLAANVSLQANIWGSLDDFYLYPVTDLEPTVETIQAEGVPQAVLNVTKQELLNAGLITEDEIASGADVKIQLKVDAVDTTVYAKEITDILDTATTAGYSVGNYLDLTLWKSVNSGTASSVSDLKSNIKVVITIPQELRAENREYAIARFHNGQVTILDGKFDSATGEFIFETNGFSVYAIVYKDIVTADNVSVIPVETAKVTSADTSDRVPMIPYLILFAAALGMIAFPVVRRRRVK